MPRVSTRRTPTKNDGGGVVAPGPRLSVFDENTGTLHSRGRLQNRIRKSRVLLTAENREPSCLLWFPSRLEDTVAARTPLGTVRRGVCVMCQLFFMSTLVRHPTSADQKKLKREHTVQ